MLLNKQINFYCWSKVFTKFILTTKPNFIKQLRDISNLSQKKPGKHKESVASEIRDHLSEINLEYFANNLPNKLLRRSSAQKVSLYLINKNTAKSLSEIISRELLKDNSFVIECNPGLGFLTEELIKIGVPKINIYEKNESFNAKGSPLTKLMIKHPSQISLTKLNLFDLWKKALRDHFYSDSTVQMYLDNLPSSKWEEKSFAQIIAACPNKTFLALFLNNLIHHTSINEHGRPTFYIIIPSHIWQVCINTLFLKISKLYYLY